MPEQLIKKNTGKVTRLPAAWPPSVDHIYRDLAVNPDPNDLFSMELRCDLLFTSYAAIFEKSGGKKIREIQ